MKSNLYIYEKNLKEIIIAILLFFIIFSGFLRIYLELDKPVVLIIDILALVLFLFFILGEYVKNNNIFLPKVTIFLFFFIAICLVNIFNPNLPAIFIGVLGFRELAFHTIFFFIGYFYLTKKEELRFVFGVGLILYLFLILYGFKQYIFGFTPEELAWNIGRGITFYWKGGYRIMSFLPSNHDFATIVGFFIIFFMVFFLYSGGIKKFLFFLLIGISVTMIILIMLRSHWFSLAFTFLFLLLIGFRVIRKNIFAIFIVIIFISVITLLMINFTGFGDVVGKRLETVTALTEDVSFRTKIDYQWSSVFKNIIIKNPFGIGLGTVGPISKQFKATLPYGHIEPDNGYLSILVQVGWVGLFVFISIFLFSLYEGLKLFRGINDLFIKKVVLSITLSIFYYLILNFGSSYFYLTIPQIFIWFSIGILYKMKRIFVD